MLINCSITSKGLPVLFTVYNVFLLKTEVVQSLAEDDLRPQIKARRSKQLISSASCRVSWWKGISRIIREWKIVVIFYFMEIEAVRWYSGPQSETNGLTLILERLKSNEPSLRIMRWMAERGSVVLITCSFSFICPEAFLLFS